MTIRTSNVEPACPMQFVLAPVGPGGWAVACSRGLIPGAILRTKEAALRYVTALAVAGGFNDVRIVVADRVTATSV